MFRADFTPVYLNFGICHRSFEYQTYLLSAELFGDLKLVLIHSFFIGDTFGEGFAIEGDSILIGAKALQLPA